jgi:hypothetical protein
MYVIVRSTPDSEPLIATGDPRIVAAVLRAVVEIAAGPDRPQLLRLVRRLEAEGPRPDPPEPAA